MYAKWYDASLQYTSLPKGGCFIFIALIIIPTYFKF